MSNDEDFNKVLEPGKCIVVKKGENIIAICNKDGEITQEKIE